MTLKAGTNTKGETTAFVRDALAGLRNLLGPLHRESHALVHAVDGHAYLRRPHPGGASPRRTRADTPAIAQAVGRCAAPASFASPAPTRSAVAG